MYISQKGTGMCSKMPADRHRLTWRQFPSWLPVAALFFVGAFIRYAGAGHDDEFIFLWAGRSLGAHSWFANSNGEAEDMVSSPLTGLLAAFADWVAPAGSLVVFKILGLCAAVAVLPLVALTASRLLTCGPAGGDRNWLVFVAVLAVALSPIFGYWALGGMESPFQALGFLLLVLALARQRATPSAMSAAGVAAAASIVVLLRMEGPWVIVLALLILVSGRERLRLRGSDIAALAVPAIAFLLVAAWRYQQTGAAWPNPVYAKGGDLAELIPLGLAYVHGFALSTPLAALMQIAAWGAFLIAWLGAGRFVQMNPAERSLVMSLSGLAVGQDIFTIFAGGNWMGYYRFLAPTLPIKILLLVWAVAYLCKPGRAAHVTATVVVVLLSLAGLQLTQSGKNPNYPGAVADPNPLWRIAEISNLQEMQRRIILASPPHARDERNLRPFITSVLPRMLQQGRPLCIATYQAGYFPWMMRETMGAEAVRIADTLGLSNRIVAQRPGRRDSLGLRDGFSIDLLIHDREPTLLALCRGVPDLVYVLHAPVSMRANMARMGYRLVWDRPGAVVFGRVAGHA